MLPRETLTDQQEERLLEVRLACPDLRPRPSLHRPGRNRHGSFLLDWIRQAEHDAPKPMSGFAGFLRQGLDAVTAGLSLHWSSGVVEGHVNRVILWNPRRQVASRSPPLRISAGLLGCEPEDSAAVDMGTSGFKPSFLVGIEAFRQAHGSRLATHW